MSRALSSVLALLLLAAGALPVAAADVKAPNADADAPPVVDTAGEVVPGEVVVKFRDPAAAADVARARGLAIAEAVGLPTRDLPAVVSTAGRPVDEVLSQLRTDPNVEYAEPSYRVQLVAAVAVNDPLTAGQYSLDQMRVRDAWSLSKGGTGVVAVLDTGVQANHADLSGRVLAGYDFVNNDTNAADDNGHGTWVAGIIAAKPNDGYGIAGISWSDKVLPVKVISSTGTGTTSDLVAGIRWAADHGATVINMSIGGFPYSQAVQDAINYAWNKGVVLVGAAGNNNRDEKFYPASMANVISVSATQVNDEFSHWSSYGDAVDVSAPGSSVQTTNCTISACLHPDWGAHTYISGTSFATPNVSGVVALIRARNPTWTPSQIVSRLFSTVDDRGYSGWDKRYGRGRVNAYRALGASVAQVGLAPGDGLEGNNALSSADVIPLAKATRPSIYPAGDVDYLAVNVPRAGRLDVRVTGVVDTRAYPWNRSSLPVDPIVSLYTASGTHLKTVDAVWENGTELAQVTVSGPQRIVVRVLNYYANGNRSAYSITPGFVDTVAPAVVARSPAPGATRVSYDGAVVTADFSEAVTGVGSSSMVLKNAAGATIGASVSYSSSSRRATLRPTSPLASEAKFTVYLSSGVRDVVGHALPATSWSFTTGKGVPRVAGADRYATAAALSASAFKPGVPVVYIATGATYPDALAGAPAARIGGGPLLLTARTSLPAPTANELTRLKPGRIVILGGTGSVSSAVQASLDAFTAGSVTRLAGADRYATAAAVSAAIFPTGAATVFVATGANFPDALAAGAAAARIKAPIVLVAPGKIPASTAAELDRLNPTKIVVMGGTGVVSEAIRSQLTAYAPTVTRVAGADRYATAVALSASSFGANSVSTVYVASGTSFPDGLAAGPIAGVRGAPLLLVPSGSLPVAVATELKRLDPTNVVIVGGTGVVRETVRSQIRALWR